MIENLPVSQQLSKSRGLLIGGALLGAVLLVTALLASVLVARSHGSMGVFAALCAFAVCWISGTLALAITLHTTGGTQAVSGMFLSIAVRTGLPLAVGVAANLVGGPLTEAGLFGLILIHYLVGLFSETCIAVKLVSTYSQRVLAS
ncbi:MAG: hypothetical protein MK171_11975 [Pirellulales bacterium]|nr:hypothetical protein [Pirellulales bacterium]